MLSFLKSYTTTKVQEAAQDATAALVAFDPEGATKAQLDLMDQKLKEAALNISRHQREHQAALDALLAAKALNTKRISVAETLQQKIDDGKTKNEDTSSLQASLERQLGVIELAQSELDDLARREKDTNDILNSLLAAHTEAANKLKSARSVLEHARHQMEQANVEADLAKQREAAAEEAAGIHKGTNSLNVALDAMTRKANALRDQASAANLNASVLGHTDSEKDDPNIAAAAAEVDAAEAPTPISAADRLARLKQKAA